MADNDKHMMKTKNTLSMRLKFLIMLLFVMLNSSTYAGIFGPSNYEDCVLQGLKEAKTETAVYVLKEMCASKFTKSEQPIEKQDLTAKCVLYWDGIKITKLTSTPKDWRNRFSAYSINKYDMEFAIIYVPKTYSQSKAGEAEMWQIANIWCK